MAYTKYSLTPANNTAAPPDGAPEGMLPSAVNDTMRDMMAQIRDCGDGIRDGTYTMTAPKITGGTITGSTINNSAIGATTASTGAFSTLSATGATTFSGATVVSGSLTANTFSSSGATITGGSVSGITDLAIADGGTGASTAAAARTNLGLDGFVNMKNRIINGAMVIDQRNAGASVTMTNPGIYDADRWYCTNASDGVMTAQQVSDAPTGFINSLKCTTTTADATLGTSQRAVVAQSIEGLNCTDLGWGTANAKTVTLSFWVKSSLTGTFGGSLRNSAADRSYPFTYVISSANTWEQKSVTIAGDTSGTWLTTNGVGIGVHFGLGVATNLSGTAGAWASANNLSTTGAVSVLETLNATWFLTGVQLEVGSTATSFDYRPYGTELALCQRYYYKATSGTLFNQIAFCNVRTTTSHYAFMQLPVTMRANPTSVDYSTVGLIASWGASVTGLNSLTFADATYGTGTTQVLLNAVPSSAVGTIGNISFLLGNNSASAYVAFNAEL